MLFSEIIVPRHHLLSFLSGGSSNTNGNEENNSNSNADDEKLKATMSLDAIWSALGMYFDVFSGFNWEDQVIVLGQLLL